MIHLHGRNYFTSLKVVDVVTPVGSIGVGRTSWDILTPLIAFKKDIMLKYSCQLHNDNSSKEISLSL